MVHRGRGRAGYGQHGFGPPGAGRGRGSATRCRWWVPEEDTWRVHARVERFIEPALLLVLRDTETHGYDLADALERLLPDERVDLGNLYRLLRGLEFEGLVSSTWRDDLPGRAKRTYKLTPAGHRLLDRWADALRENQDVVAAFLARFDARNEPEEVSP